MELILNPSGILLLILPAFFALAVFLVPQKFVRAFGLIGALVVLAFVLTRFCSYDPQQGMQYIMKGPWMPSLGITMNFGYDAISLIMLLLTTVLVPLILLSNYARELASNKLFTSMVFLMQLGLIGVFISMDAIWFYVFWEVTLIPIYLICFWYGDPERKAALTKFFIYTFFGSLFMLASIIGLKQYAPTFALEHLYLTGLQIAPEVAIWLLSGFFLAFAIKIPVFPFHTWQPDTYSKAPMAGTMLLSGIMLKMALYGMIRWILPIFPQAMEQAQWPIIILAVIGVVYGAILAIKQNDMKRLFAFASISHVGLIAAGIMTFDAETISGSILQMVNHGLVAVGLFLAADVIERRLGTRSLRDLGGIAKQAPKFAFWFAALAFASVSVPFTSGFIGEFLLLKGLYSFDAIIGIVAGTTLILGAVYTFRAYQLSMYGPVNTNAFSDLSWSEIAVFVIIMVAVVFLGVYPKAIIDFVQPSVNQLVIMSKSQQLLQDTLNSFMH